MNEHDANRALLAARLTLVDPLEETQFMPIRDRRYRQREGRYMHETARGLGHARAMVNNPVYRAQEINAGSREPGGIQRQIDTHVDDLVRRLGWAITVAEPTELDRINRQLPDVTLYLAVACPQCGNTPCPGCQPCCGSTLGRDPEDGSCRGCG